MENRDRKIVYNAELFIIFWKTRTRELLQSLMRLNLRLVKEVLLLWVTVDLEWLLLPKKFEIGI